MAKWHPIVYRDFYDVPRAFVVNDEKRTLFFVSSFDEALDDYREDYDVYEMLNLSETELKGSWENLEQRAKRKLGSIRVAGVHFDSTLRREVDLDVLQTLDVKQS